VVADTGAAGGAGRLRALNRPRPVRVEADGEGRPLAVWVAGQRQAVECVLESWRIDDEWWRPQAVSRLYWRLVLADGRTATVYRELVKDRWFRQSYG